MTKYLILIFISISSAFAIDERCVALLDKIVEDSLKLSTKVTELKNQYRDHLSPFENPFLQTISIERSHNVFQQMLTRNDGSEVVLSPLAKIYEETIKHILEDKEYNQSFINKLIRDIERDILKENLRQRDLQSNYLGLDYIDSYLKRFQRNNRKQKELDESIDDAKIKTEELEEDKVKEKKKNKDKKNNDESEDKESKDSDEGKSEQGKSESDESDSEEGKSESGESDSEESKSESGEGDSEEGKSDSDKSESQEGDSEPGENSDSKADSDSSKSEDKEGQYPKAAREYDPSTKDLPDLSDDQESELITKINFNGDYFAHSFMNKIVKNGNPVLSAEPLPLSKKYIGNFEVTKNKMTVHTLGSKSGDLNIPSGYSVLQSSDPRVNIYIDDFGVYRFKIKNNDGPKVFILPIVKTKDFELLPHEKQILSMPTGFFKEEWPDSIKILLESLKHNDNIKSVSSIIEEHIQTKYLYATSGRDEKNVTEAFHARSFQCDFAALGMASIIRDEFKVPTRVVLGYRKSGNTKDGGTVLSTNVVGHAWVEVYHDNKWNRYDPTPIKKDKKDPSDELGEGLDSGNPERNGDEANGDSKGDTNEDGNEDSAKEGEDSSSEGSSSNDGKESSDSTSEGNSKNVEDNDLVDAEDTSKTDEDSSGGSAGDKTDNKTAGDNDEIDSAKIKHEDDLNKLINELSTGSVLFDSEKEKDKLTERVLRVLIKDAISPLNDGPKVLDKLSSIGTIVRSISSPELTSFYDKALTIHGAYHPSLSKWIDRISTKLDTVSLNDSYKELSKVFNTLKIYAEILDKGSRESIPRDLLLSINDLLSDFDKLKDVNSLDIGLVENFESNLPGISKKLLKEAPYNLDTVGNNKATLEIAEKLRENQMADLRLLSLLSGAADFVLNSTPRPEYEYVKTWLEDSSKRVGRDILPFRRYSDLSRVILGSPGRSLEENIEKGTAFVLKKRKLNKIATGAGEDDVQRVTIVGYDVSGSMHGALAEFQAALISAFTSKVLSDRSESGVLRHKVVLVPFDDKVGTPVTIESVEDGLNIVRNYRSKLNNSGGGTDIQKFLIEAMAMIAEAEKRQGSPLAAANIILMSDGESKVDFDVISDARKLIDRGTPIQNMFIAIGGSNKELMKFALESEDSGIGKGFYREFTNEQIYSVINESKSLDLEESSKYFYTDKEYSEIPKSMVNKLLTIQQLARNYEYRLGQEKRSVIGAEDYYNSSKFKRFNDIDYKGEDLIYYIKNLRIAFEYQSPLKDDPKLQELVLDDILQNFHYLTGKKIESLSDFEKESLNWLIAYVAKIERD